MDEIDRRILRELVAGPRLPVAQLAVRVGLSRPAVADRVRRLERDGIIAGWRVDLDPKSLGLSYTVLIRIRPSAGRAASIESLVRTIPAIVECYRTTGEESFVLKAHVATVPEFEELVARLHRYGETTASDVLSAVVPPRAPPLPQGSVGPTD